MIGRKFGRLRVIARNDNRGKEAGWLCICKCGGQKTIRGNHLRSGQTRSCGCLALECKNIIGNRYGKLVVLCKHANRDKFGRVQWLCQCDCGEKATIITANLRFRKDGKPKQGSCGCDQWALRVSPHSYVLRNYRQAAKRYGRAFELSEESFVRLISSNCDYCGLKPSHQFPPSHVLNNATHAAFRWSGIDRIDSAKGYVEGNVVPCCKACNELKSDKSREEFLVRIEAIYRHQNRQRAASA